MPIGAPNPFPQTTHRRPMTTARVPNHTHCTQCGRAIPPEQKVCSTECQAEIDETNRNRKKMMYFTYGLLVVGFLLLVVGPIFFER